MKTTISKEDFGLLCVCAIRYCMGRETYMPELIQGIVKENLKNITDKDLGVMISDCEWQKDVGMYGDPYMDKPGWQLFAKKLKEEQERRRDGN